MHHGGLAQLGEHLLCKQGVVGSIPSSSTIMTMATEAHAFGCKPKHFKQVLGFAARKIGKLFFNNS